MNRHSLLISLCSFFSIADPPEPPDPQIMKKVQELQNLATVSYRIQPGQIGQVKYRGSYWSACCLDEDLVLLPGAQVRVIERVELTLVVELIALPQSQSLPSEKSFDQIDRTA